MTMALLLMAFSSTAQEIRTLTDYQSPVRAGTKITCLDLLRKIFPDVQMDAGAGQEAKAQTSIPLNHLFGDYRGKVYRGEMRITAVYTPVDQRRNPDRMLLLVQAHSEDGDLFTWGDISVLALFQLEPTVKLLDATDTQADRFNGFWDEQPILHLGPQASAFMIANSHHNSSQGYLGLTLVSAENNRLKTIFDMPLLLNTNGCGNNFTQTPTIKVLKGNRGARSNLSVQVKLEKEPDEESCEKRSRGYTRYYRALLVWNSAKHKYESRGNALDRLARFNERKY